jgi:hypothetical protein
VLGYNITCHIPFLLAIIIGPRKQVEKYQLILASIFSVTNVQNAKDFHILFLLAIIIGPRKQVEKYQLILASIFSVTNVQNAKDFIDHMVSIDMLSVASW